MTYRASESRYETMTYRRAGASGLKLPLLSLGLWHNFGTNDDYDNMKRMCFAAFDRGVDLALQTASLLGSAFSARTLSLFDQLPAAALPSYLSGLVIGEELRAQAPQTSFVVVMGTPALTQRYDRALAHCGIATQHIGAQATWQGLWAIARTLEGTS